MRHVDDSAGSDMLSSVHDELECNFDLVGNILTANFIFSKTESAAL